MSFRFNQGDRPLDGFTIQRGVGRGGFGEVYYAVSDGGKEVALKYLRDNPSVELRGVAACLNLKSPHLVSVHDVRQNAAGDWFIVMEYVAGPSLRELMTASPGGLGAQKAAYLVREIGKGLSYLHDRGIVHRDLKPGNVFYDEGYVKIGDYGLSKFMTASQHSGQTVSVGTVHYMAPEIGSGNYDRTIDIYALGVMLYEMLLGKVPFAGATVGEILMKHLTAQPEVDALPAPFPDVIRKTLSKDPKDRYATVPEMLKAIFAESQLDRSVAAFEPASLSVAAARVAPELGGGAAVATGSSNVGAWGEAAGAPSPPIVDPKRRGIDGRAGLDDRRPLPDVPMDSTAAPRPPATSRALVERVLIALLLLAGFSFVTGYWIADHAPTLGQCLKVTLPIAAIVQGVIVGCWLGFERYKLQSAWLTRLLIAALVGIVVVTSPSPLDGIVRASREPSVPEKVVAKVEQKVAEKLEGRGRSRTAARDERVADAEPKSRVDKIGPIGPIVDAASAIKTSQPIALPIILLMLLADWPKRYYGGRRGQISLGLAFYAWLGTLIVANITGVTPAMPVALIVAAASLALQAVAGLWPLADATAIPLPIRRELGALGRDPDVGPRVTPVVTSKFGEFIGRRKRGAHAEEAARTPVPVLPASGGGRDAQEKNARTSRRGGWLLAIGIVWSCALGAVIPALVHVFNRTPNQWLIPTFLIPNFMCAVGLIIWGALLLHAAAKRNPFVLPLRRVFDVPHSADLAATIERHFIALSYSIDARDDLLWTFRRKSSGWSRFWGHTIRASVAGYRLAGGGCQLRCYVDAEYTWDTPEKKEIQALWNELEELRSLLGAREIEEAAEAVA